MTNEQAIKMLKSKMDGNTDTSYEWAETVRMAIRALEQEPCETIKEIPKDYKYDTETKDFLVYRHKYTGHEIHIEKPSPIYRLEQEPCEDCISRQAVEEMIKAEMPERGMWEIEGDKEKETVCEVCVELMQKLSELSPIMPQPKTGEWIQDCISRKSIKQKLQEHHDFYINAYGGFRNLPQNDKSRVDEITNCIAMVVNEPPVTSHPTRWIPISERVPEYGEPVLTWDGNCYFVEKRIPCIRDENGEPIFSDWWVSDDYDEKESDYYPNLRDGACIAWMPLPSQWKGTDLEDDD